MSTRLLLVAAFAIALSTSAAGAQHAPSAERPADGSRVRLVMTGEALQSAGHYMIEGTLVGGDSTRAVVQQPGHAAPDTVPMFTVDRFQVYAGQHSRRKMILGGAAAGAGISLVIRGADNLTRGTRCEKACTTSLVPTYVYAVPVVIGALLGSVFPATHWKEVPRNALAVGPMPGHGVRIASTIHFR